MLQRSNRHQKKAIEILKRLKPTKVEKSVSNAIRVYKDWTADVRIVLQLGCEYKGGEKSRENFGMKVIKEF